MHIGIYKPGQGYWVRVLSAVFMGALVLSGAMWAWSQAGSYTPPMPTWEVDLAAVRGEFTPGVQINLLAPSNTVGAEDEIIGTATIDSYSPGENQRGTIIVSNIKMDPDRSMLEVRRVEYPDMIGGGHSFSAEISNNGAFGIPAFDVIYLQAIVAGAILLLGSIAVYMFVGTLHKPVDFLIATDGEMKKVNWSTRKEIQGSTTVVIIASFLLAIMIFVVDLGFQQLFRAVGVLQ